MKAPTRYKLVGDTMQIRNKGEWMRYEDHVAILEEVKGKRHEPNSDDKRGGQ